MPPRLVSTTNRASIVRAPSIRRLEWSRFRGRMRAVGLRYYNRNSPHPDRASIVDCGIAMSCDPRETLNFINCPNISSLLAHVDTGAPLYLRFAHLAASYFYYSPFFRAHKTSEIHNLVPMTYNLLKSFLFKHFES